ncbi:hypothetical protein BGZ83_004304 [Gryganskiella cystojenkinii]|nr:hypothetical protein BGZ83_004304 [Gryganskiella cystojenkinii]
MASTPQQSGRPSKSLKLSSERRPFFTLDMPVSCLKTRPFSLHGVRSTSSEGEVIAPGIVPSFSENEPMFRSRNVQFNPETDDQSESKASPLPRTPYPMTSQDEERLQRLFFRPSAGDLELVPE